MKSVCLFCGDYERFFARSKILRLSVSPICRESQKVLCVCRQILTKMCVRLDTQWPVGLVA